MNMGIGLKQAMCALLCFDQTVANVSATLPYNELINTHYWQAFGVQLIIHSYRVLRYNY